MRPILLRPTPHAIALLAFLAFYTLLLCDIRHWSWRDPGSYFFDPARAFEREYSLRREAEAEKFITATASTGAGNHGGAKAGLAPSFCVGIPTVQRDGARYFRRALGSVLEGLTVTEREDLWVVPFIVNLDPEEHQAYHESWLEQLADEVLTYTDAGEEVVARLEEVMVGDGDHKKKALFDYTYLMRMCGERNTTWTLILEDDTVAANGWYLRTRDALMELEGRGEVQRMVYLRLFYNERLLGWNSEEWLGYTTRSVLVVLGVFGVLATAFNYVLILRPIITPRTIAVVTFLITPLLITTLFLAGRLTVVGPARGVNRMDSYGCCSQAFVFPQLRMSDLLAWYDQHANGYLDPVTGRDRTQVDSLTEVFAEQKGLGRWALTPSVFQHVGGKSTKPTSITRWGRSNAENIWNFGFEVLDGDELKKEHLT